MFYDEDEQGVSPGPSEPVEETEEDYRLTEPATPQGPSTKCCTQHTSDTEGVLSEDYDYLFEGEPDSPARFSPPDVRDGDVDPLALLNVRRDVDEDRRLNADGHGQGQQEAPFMSGALPSSFDFGTQDRPEIRIRDPRASFVRSRKESRGQTPTESDLEREDFQFHKVIEKIKSKHTRQALQGVDPSLSRQELFRTYRRAVEAEGDDFELYRPDTPMQEYDSDGLDDSPIAGYNEDVSPCDDGEEPSGTRRESSCKRPGQLPKGDNVRHPHPTEMRTSSAEALHQSLMHSKPHLSEITPTEAQGHHPSVIPRSPQRQSSRASSLSSETRLNLPSRIPEPPPLTEEALARKNEEVPSSGLAILLFPAPPTERQPSPFRRPNEPASSTILSSPLRKAFDSIDASSTRAMIGSPAPTVSQPISRPDTPRPSFATQRTQEESERGDYLNLSQRYSQPAQIATSSTPSSSTDRDVSMLDTPDLESPTPTKIPTHAQSAAGISLLHLLPPSYAAIRSTALLPAAATYPEVSSAFAANISPEKSPLQPLPGLTLQETLASVLASVTRNRSPTSQQLDAPPPRSISLARPAPSSLDEPWHEPVRATDNLSHYPPVKSASPPKRPSRGQHQRNSNATRQLLPKKPSDPFAANNDMITFLAPSDSPPLSPLTGIAGQIYQSKRGQRKATTPGRVARRAATGTRAVSAISPRKARAPARDHDENSKEAIAKRSKSTNLGVRGDGAKVTKTRATGRKASTKTPKKKVTESEGIPDVPALPTEMEIDSSTEQGTPIRPTKLAGREQEEPNVESSTPSRRTPKKKREETPQAMDIDRIESQATPDVLEQLERDQWHVIEGAAGQPVTPIRSEATTSRRSQAAKIDNSPKTPSRRASRKNNADLPQEMDIDSPQGQSESQPVPSSHSDVSPKQAPGPGSRQQIAGSPSKRTLSKRKPTPSQKKLASDEAQPPKTPSRTPRRKNEATTGERLTPRSAQRAKERQTPTRQSPRLIEKRKRELGEEVEFEKGPSVM